MRRGKSGKFVTRSVMTVVLVAGMFPSALVYASEADAASDSTVSNSAEEGISTIDEYGYFAVSEEVGEEYAESTCSISEEMTTDEKTDAQDVVLGDGGAEKESAVEPVSGLIDTAVSLDEEGAKGASATENGMARQEELSGASDGGDARLSSNESSDRLAVVGQRCYDDSYEVLNQVNVQRAEAGLSALTMDEELLNAAMLRAAELSILFDHTRPTGNDCYTASNKMSGENIACGQRSASEVMNSWMDSPDHRENILRQSFKSVGIGCFKVGGVYYWVQCFGFGGATEVSNPGSDTAGCAIAYDGSCLGNQGVEISVCTWSSDHKRLSYEDKITVPLGTEQEYGAVLFPARGLSFFTPLYHGEGMVSPVQTAGSEDNETWSSNGCWWFGAGAVGKYTITVALGSSGPSASLTHEVVGDAEEASVNAGAARRIQGNTRYDTMRKISKQGFSSADTAILASGANFPDALGASSLAGAYEAPILLSDPNSLSWQARFEIRRLGVKGVYLIGGSAALSENVKNELESMGVEVRRVEGSTRQQTAARVGQMVASYAKPSTAIIAAGSKPWDSLSISSYAYARKYPIFLAENDGTLSEDTLNTLLSSGVTSVIVVGGDGAVSTSVEKQLAGLNPQRLWGSDRYETSAAIVRYAISDNPGQSCSTVAIASGTSFPDALSGAALLGKSNGVVMLSDPINGSRVASELAAINQGGAVRTCYILGGKGAIGEGVEKSINAVLS